MSVRETDMVPSPRSADRPGADVAAREGHDPADPHRRVDDHDVSARTVVALDALLLDSKLSVPQPRPGSVSRAGLIETARASDCRVIGVTAPAGYGKSTLLVEWALAEDRRVRMELGPPHRITQNNNLSFTGLLLRGSERTSQCW